MEHNNPECKLFISDPPKGYNDDLSNIDIAFLQIHGGDMNLSPLSPLSPLSMFIQAMADGRWLRSFPYYLLAKTAKKGIGCHRHEEKLNCIGL